MRPEVFMARRWEVCHTQGGAERATSKGMRGAYERCEVKPEREELEVLREGTALSRKTWAQELGDNRKEQE